MQPLPPVEVVWHEYGDAGLLGEVLADCYEERWSVTQSLGASVRETPPPGFVDIVASYQNVFVSFDPLLTDHDSMREAVAELLGPPRDPRTRRLFDIAVIYGGEFGPDLDSVAAELEISSEEVVERHLSGDWVVRFTGSPVGAPMMDGPRMPRSVARMKEPRARVEPGSVAISGLQSTIYPAPSPGGWRLIGRTPALLFDLNRPPHVPYRPGDIVHFVRIRPDEWQSFEKPLAPRITPDTAS